MRVVYLIQWDRPAPVRPSLFGKKPSARKTISICRSARSKRRRRLRRVICTKRATDATADGRTDGGRHVL